MEISRRLVFLFLLAFIIVLKFQKCFQLQSRQINSRPISEYLSPEMKTVIEYDCMPTYANILAASIVDMDDNRVIKSFGIKKGMKLKSNSRMRHQAVDP